MAIEKDKVAHGGQVNYYLVEVTHPNRPDQPAYTAECDDICSGLGLTGYEFNVVKAIWRSANMRNHGLGKPGNKADGIYDGEKIAHYGPLILKERKLKEEKRQQALKDEAAQLLVRGDIGEGPNLARREEDFIPSVVPGYGSKIDLKPFQNGEPELPPAPLMITPDSQRGR